MLHMMWELCRGYGVIGDRIVTGVGCTWHFPVSTGGFGVQMHHGNVEWMWVGICRAMCRSRVRGYEGLEVVEKAPGMRAVCFG